MIKNDGFTLLELLIVLAISVLSLSIVGINISSGNKTTALKAASRDLSSALRYARGQSLISQKEVKLTLDLATNRYRISSREKAYQLAKEIELTLFSAQVEIEDQQKGSIRFFPDGSSTGGSITLEQDDLKWVVKINWLTGQIKIEEE